MIYYLNMINGLINSIRFGAASGVLRRQPFVSVRRRYFSSEFKRFFGYEEELEQTKVKND